MELDKIKQEWGMLTNKLDQIESLNNEILERMVRNNAKTTQDRLMRYECRFLILCYSFAIVYGILFILYSDYIKAVGLTGAFWLFEAVMIIAGSWQGYKMWLLTKMNVAKCSPIELIEHSIRFKVITKMRLIVGIASIFPIMGLAYYLMQDYLVGDMYIMMIVAGVVGFVIGLIAEMKHFRNINQLIALLKDIKESRKD